MKHARFIYLFYGALTGWFLGYILGMASYGWYFAPRNGLLIYSILGAIFTSLLYNGVMMVEGYSNKLRYTVTGLLLGSFLACIGGIIYVGGLDLTKISFQNGLVFEWALIHCGIIIGIIGFLIGSRADKRLSHSIS
jgi:hypothetical protein